MTPSFRGLGAFGKEVKAYYRTMPHPENKCYAKLNNKYYKKNKPSNKINQITRFKGIQHGKIYTFQYRNPKTKDKLEYYDVQPNVFVLNTFKAETTNNDIIMGINLNFIPQTYRIQILDLVQQHLKSAYDADKGTRLQNSIV
jgi:hypothetical protein